MNFEKLGNIILIAKGRKATISDIKSPSSIRLIQIDDLRNDFNIKYSDENSGVYASKEDVLIAWDGANAGTVGYGKSGLIGSTIALLRKREQNKFYTPFLGKFLQSKSKFLRDKATGATIPHINRSSLENLLVPLFSPSDQVRIATVLENAEKLIILRRESILLLDEFLKSTFYQMFGDVLKGENPEPLGKAISLISGAAFKSSDFKDQGVPVIKIGTVNKGYFDISTLSFLPEKSAYEKYGVLPGELLVSLTGTTGKDDYANTCFVTSEYSKYYLNQRVAKIVVDSSALTLNFVHHLFRFPPFKRKLIKSDKGVRQANLSNNDIYNFKITFPAIDQQNIFDRISQKVDDLKSQFQESLKELENLYNSLIQRAFTGELDLSKLAVEYDEEYFASANDRTEPIPIDWDRVTVRPKTVPEMSLDEFYGIPDEIVEEHGSIAQHEFNWEYFFKHHFSDRPITTDLVEQFYYAHNYERGFDFDYEEFASVVFNELKKENSYLQQTFDEATKQIVLTVKNETA